ncbi:hypothetical protein C8F04DRAFT_1248520 [Mycena alexandri]|uniref:F-box domain-containing protein n=1 Tax=Mycena alexandri TaxID=1745969 RepID=A0AAD6XBH6_9AGAR|nr:hypothetical protein C8F04DRAFT_1248520 [Mycena alexandri]
MAEMPSPDLLYLILRDALSAGPHHPSISALHRCNIALTCKQFATIATNIPHAWNKIVIPFVNPPSCRYIRRCISLSEAVPLEVSLICNISAETPPGPLSLARRCRSHRAQAFVHQFMTLLDEHFSRIEALSVQLADGAASELWLRYLTRMNCAVLQALSMRLHLTSDIEVAGTRAAFTTLLPSIRTLTCVAFFPPATFAPAAGALTSLAISRVWGRSSVVYDEVMDMLAALPNLHTLRLGRVECAFAPSAPVTSTPRVVALPLVDTVDFFVGPPSTTDILCSLSLPAMKTLNLDIFPSSDLPWFSARCENLLAGCKTFGLRLVGDVDPKPVTAMLSFTPNVTCLSFARTPPQHAYVVHSAIGPAKLPLLARLEVPWSVHSDALRAHLQRRIAGAVIEVIQPAAKERYTIKSGTLVTL